MFIIGQLTLGDILNDIYYITENSRLTPEYIENLTIFERDYYMYKILAELKKEAERKAKAKNG